MITPPRSAYVLGVCFETLTTAVPETEPNEDGSPSVGNGTSAAEGTDFSIAAANGAFTVDTVIGGAFSPTIVYAHVMDSGDDTAAQGYNLHVSFP